MQSVPPALLRPQISPNLDEHHTDSQMRFHRLMNMSLRGDDSGAEPLNNSWRLYTHSRLALAPLCKARHYLEPVFTTSLEHLTSPKNRKHLPEAMRHLLLFLAGNFAGLVQAIAIQQRASYTGMLLKRVPADTLMGSFGITYYNTDEVPFGFGTSVTFLPVGNLSLLRAA